MPDTPGSLLAKVQLQPGNEAWQELFAIYSPWLLGWLRRYEMQPADAEDLLQEVLQTVVKELPQFKYNQRRGSFRRWLKTILVHRMKAFWKSVGRQPKAVGGSDSLTVLTALEDPHSDLSHQWEREHNQHIVHQLLERIKPDFQPATWQAFHLVVEQGRLAADVADELGLTVNAVLCAKSRVLRRLREVAAGLIE